MNILVSCPMLMIELQYVGFFVDILVEYFETLGPVNTELECQVMPTALKCCALSLCKLRCDPCTVVPQLTAAICRCL